MEVHSLRTSLVAVLVPTGLLTAAGVAVTLTQSSYELGGLVPRDLPLIALLALAVVAALTVARDPGRVRPVLALSVLGFALAGVYAMVGAPDVALVAVVIETIVTLVFVAIFVRLPGTDELDESPEEGRDHRRRNRLAGVIAGAGAFAVIWAALSLPVVPGNDASRQTVLTPEAHGADVVTVILADFRGFDTLVEITVLAVAVIGVATLLRQGKLW
jgi:multicomponent Na+:H+ antiporter subunit A